MRHLASLFVTLLVLCLCATAQAASPNGILLAAFGTSMEDARPALQSIEDAYRKTYAGQPIVMAYTSDIIRKKLAEKGQKVFSVKEALDECARLGVVNLRVQSLHVTGGEEYSMLQRMLVRNLTKQPGRFTHVWLGAPMLQSEQDLKEVSDALFASFPASRTKHDAVLLMGHGNDRGPGDLDLAATAAALNKRDPLVFLATVEGAHSFDAILPRLKASGVRKVWLQPFMVVAGDHSRNDLAGDEEDSWASRLKAAGMEVEVNMIGLGSIDGIRKVFLRHTRTTSDDLAHPKKSD